MSVNANTRFDRYAVGRLLGEGEASAVYLAVHESLGSVHALKIPQVSAPSVWERLLREGRLQAGVSHPNVVSVTDVLQLEGQPALVLEHVNGPSLEAFLRDHAPSVGQALRIFHGIVRGVAAIHEAGLIHCDLKPANVLLAPVSDGFIPKISDFGLACGLSGPDAVPSGWRGTPGYMAPEQLREEADLDERADLFALGAILYELVTGHRAFEGPDVMLVAEAVCAGRYTAPAVWQQDLPERVASVIQRLLEVDRDQRLGSCTELLRALYGKSATADTFVDPLSFEEVPLRVDLVSQSALISSFQLPQVVQATPERSTGRLFSALAVLIVALGSVGLGGFAALALLLGALASRPGAVPQVLEGGEPRPEGVPAGAELRPEGGGAAPGPAPAVGSAGAIEPPSPDPVGSGAVGDPNEARTTPSEAPASEAPASEAPASEAPALAAPAPVAPAPAVAPSSPEPPAGIAGDPPQGRTEPPVGEPEEAAGGAPQPPVATGVLRLEGDADVILLDADGAPVAPGALAAGRYRWSATFPDRTTADGGLTLEPGAELTLRCVSFALRCVVRTGGGG